MLVENVGKDIPTRTDDGVNQNNFFGKQLVNTHPRFKLYSLRAAIPLPGIHLTTSYTHLCKDNCSRRFTTIVHNSKKLQTT